ncbi:MAG: hypothetical protein HC935_00395 [Pseudanabaena sp. SU_2_4]|nr:hypothetical protein [Pseudanabaena sp. SU_2_4]
MTFPQIGVYKLELSGSPKPSAKFAPFSLSYKVVVAGKSEVSKEPDKGTELSQLL